MATKRMIICMTVINRVMYDLQMLFDAVDCKCASSPQNVKSFADSIPFHWMVQGFVRASVKPIWTVVARPVQTMASGLSFDK